ncbi:hypothetical protein B484DRAFT_341658 [Ochromonadaceae sp. CCMP2298]|nr:hypothetical protein B484DRAFT_341658 [Ochromonadaceae sp. CCMP2298]
MLASRLLRTRQSATLARALSSESLQETSFHALHLSLGGKMVPFAGYSLPVQYDGLGVLKEHVHTRSATGASVFDVGHMGQIKWHGKDAVAFLEKMVVGDIASLKEGEAKLSLIMNEAGTIMDDTVITNAGDHMYMVVNGACKVKDMAHFNRYLKEFKMDVTMEYQEDQQLLALQGKGAAAVAGRLIPSLDLQSMQFMTGTVATVAGIPNCRVTRCGYTGEDGFEISVAKDKAMALMEALLAEKNVQVAGLGARDSLRLEAGLCLYGNDIDETTNPVEGALTWTIGERGRVESRESGVGSRE